MNRQLAFLLSLFFVVFFAACDPDSAGDDDNPTADFDRQAMLADWVDNVIVPGYTDLESALGTLLDDTRTFTDTPTEENRTALRTSYRNAYLAYQTISPFLIGRAEEIRLREQLNTYPADVELIRENATGNAPNLELPSNTAAQGFPALDYLLYGLNENVLLADDNEAAAYNAYLLTLVERINALTSEAASDWTESTRAEFIANDGNSATASIDRTVNDYIFYYEKFLRAGKVGIPAGVFSDDPLADRAEALYSGLSPELFAVALDATEDFFTNHGLADYLDAMEVERDGANLSTSITNQFSSARTAASTIDLPFHQQVTTDNIKMLELYNELQRNVILLKVDMLQALSINVDYVDADGD